MIDFFASEEHFVDHLAPIWQALRPSERGYFIVPRPLVGRAAKRGVTAGPEQATPNGPILVASYGDVKKARRMGRTRIAFIEHGIGQSYAGDPKAADLASYAGGRDRGDVGLFMTPNRHSADRWRAAYPDARVEIVGSPKLDNLPTYEPTDEPVICLSFHWDCSLVPETRSTFPYFKDVLPALAQRFKVIGHAHPRAIDRLGQKYRRMGIEVVPDFADVLRRAAVYVCDNSSSLYEFAATGRPVVVLNEPPSRAYGRGYRRDVSHGLRFWDAADVGINVWTPDALDPAIEHALADPSDIQDAREAALRIVYEHRSGAADRAADAVLEWAGLRVRVAA